MANRLLMIYLVLSFSYITIFVCIPLIIFRLQYHIESCKFRAQFMIDHQEDDDDDVDDNDYDESLTQMSMQMLTWARHINNLNLEMN